MERKKTVLLLTPYLYCPEIPAGDRNQSGLAYMVRGIADEIGNYCDLRVLTQSYFSSKGVSVSNFFIERKRWFDLISSLRLDYLKLAISISKRDHLNVEQTLRLACYSLCGSYSERMINKINPSVVFIHSVSYYTIPFLLAAAKAGVPAVVSLHGLISMDRDVVSVGDTEADLERNLVRAVDEFGFGLTMIASGMKKRMRENLGRSLDSVRIVSNFCGKDIEDRAAAFEKKETGEPGVKTVLCVGTVYKLKNQLEVIKAIEILTNAKELNIRLVLAGDGPDLAMLKQYVVEHSVPGVEFLGRVKHLELIEEYKRADLVVMASLTEGFGLPLLEGFWFGVPGVAFSDVDAFEDLYAPCAMVGVSERSTIALANAIRRALLKEWDRSEIVDNARRFSRRKIGEKYYRVLSEANSPIPISVFDFLIEGK